ncbi:MAG: hypothetical protein M3530_12440 [Thermoproteota archaeon]|nr:hypothetical protein [Thermoproteota archaeon]
MEKGRLSILIMEDDREIASLYRHILDSRGHKVTITRLGEEPSKFTLTDYKKHLPKNPGLPKSNSLTWLYSITRCQTEMGWK